MKLFNPFKEDEKDKLLGQNDKYKTQLKGIKSGLETGLVKGSGLINYKLGGGGAGGNFNKFTPYAGNDAINVKVGENAQPASDMFAAN